MSTPPLVAPRESVEQVFDYELEEHAGDDVQCPCDDGEEASHMAKMLPCRHEYPLCGNHAETATKYRHVFLNGSRVCFKCEGNIDDFTVRPI